MAYSFKLPDVGEGVAEVEIVAWHVAAGDQVEEDQPLVDVMTDKATVEITSPVSGRVTSITGAVGATATVGSVLVVFDADSAEPPPQPAANSAAKPLASPAVRREAQQKGIDLRQVRGGGPEGRVTHADLVAPPPPAAGRREGRQDIPLIGLRRKIAERMALSTRRIAHFSYVEEIDVTELEALRADLNARHGRRQRLTLLSFLVRALTVLLPEFPQINATFDDEAGVVSQWAPVHVGVAVQTDAGLTAPVIRHAEAMSLWQVAAEITRLAKAARGGRATREELTGSTITVTSLGVLGGVSTTPVINPPEVAIIGPNRIIERPVAVDGAIAVRKMMNLSSSFDHRVVDGHDAARFVQRLKMMLEHPALLFVGEP